MKITRRQLSRIIKEELSLLESNDKDVDIAADQNTGKVQHYSQVGPGGAPGGGGSYPSNMTEDEINNLLKDFKYPSIQLWVKFFNDLSKFGNKYLRGNLLALGYAHSVGVRGGRRGDVEEKVSKFFAKLSGRLKKTKAKKGTEFSHIEGLLNTLKRLGTVHMDRDK